MEQKTLKDPSGYNVRAVERALQILECFDDEHPEKGVSEIAQAVDLHKATAHRIMTTLMNYGYLERADDGQKYRLGIRLTELGFKVIRRMDLRRESLSFMNQLSKELGEACDLSILDNDNVFYIEVIQDSHALSISAAVGQRLPAHCTASGKLFLAHLPQEKLDAFLKKPLQKYTVNTIISKEKFQQELDSIRRQGFAVDDEEMEIGIRAVAAPIFDRESRMVAAMSIPAPTSRMSLERVQEIAQALTTTTREVSRRLGWRA